MFKDKNLVTKISNGTLIFIFLIMLLTGASLVAALITGDTSSVEGYTHADYVYNAIMSIMYMIFSGGLLIYLNKKLNIYKDEYPVTRQVFNFFFVISMLGNIISIFMIAVGYFVYDEMSWYSLLTTIFNIGIFIGTYIYLLKGKLLNLENTKKTNIINLIIILLLMEYVSGIINLLFQLLFKINSTSDITKNIIIYLVGICVVILAFKLFDKTKDKKNIKEEIKEPVKEVKVIEVKEEKKKPAKKKKVTKKPVKKSVKKVTKKETK